MRISDWSSDVCSSDLDVAVYTTRGYMIHAGTPPERVKILSDALVQAMQSDRFKKYLTDSGLDPETSVAGSEVWDAQLKEMYAKEKAVIDELGLAKQWPNRSLQGHNHYESWCESPIEWGRRAFAGRSEEQ